MVDAWTGVIVGYPSEVMASFIQGCNLHSKLFHSRDDMIAKARFCRVFCGCISSNRTRSNQGNRRVVGIAVIR